MKRSFTGRDPLPAKRSKSTSVAFNSAETDVGKSLTPVAEKTSRTKTKTVASHVQTKPYFNQLPSPPQTLRPGLLLFGWGSGADGQLGMGRGFVDEYKKPKRNIWVEEQMKEGTFGGDNAGIEAVAAGGMHSLFIDEKGIVWSFGVNDEAALGRVTSGPSPNNSEVYLNDEELSSFPHPVQSLVDENFRAVHIVAGDNISAALSSTGDLRVWGSFHGVDGSMGFADGQKRQYKPVSILELPHKPGDAEKISSIAAGANHLIVLTTHGNIYTWGASEQAQLGRRVPERLKLHGTVPGKVVLGHRSRKAKVVGAGAFHSFAVDDKGDVWGWGLNSIGQTGTGFESAADSIVQLPQKVIGLSKEELAGDEVIHIEGGGQHSLFLTAAGKVYACGRGVSSELGIALDDPVFEDRDTPSLSEPAVIAFPDPNDPVIQISCGSRTNSAVTRGGALYVWGEGLNGQLGAGDEENSETPRLIVRKEGGQWFAAAVTCGGQHTLGLFRKK